MKIVQIIDLLNTGGAQTLLVTLAREFQAREDTEMAVINLLDPDEEDSTVIDDLEELGVRVYPCPCRRAWNPRRIQRMVRFLRQEKFDVAHLHLTTATVVGTVAGKLAGVPTVATLHNVESHLLREKYTRWYKLEGWSLRYGAREVIAVGPQVAESYQQRLGKKRIWVIPNAVPIPQPLACDLRAAVRTELCGDACRPLLISVGRLVYQKAIDDMLVAFKQVLESNPSAVLVVAGDGSERPRLEKVVEDMGLQDRALLLGSRQDVQHLLAASDIFVNSSRWEGLPVAVLEAMASGLPVVATAVGDVPTVVQDGAGILVPPEEPDALADALNSLLSEPEQWKAMGERGRTHIIENYGARSWADKVMTVYEEAVGKAELAA